MPVNDKIVCLSRFLTFCQAVIIKLLIEFEKKYFPNILPANNAELNMWTWQDDNKCIFERFFFGLYRKVSVFMVVYERVPNICVIHCSDPSNIMPRSLIEIVVCRVPWNRMCFYAPQTYRTQRVWCLRSDIHMVVICFKVAN